MGLKLDQTQRLKDLVRESSTLKAGGRAGTGKLDAQEHRGGKLPSRERRRPVERAREEYRMSE